jgi:hypothetical protein
VKPTLYDCPASSTRTRKPIRGAVAAVALNESMLVEMADAEGYAPAINKTEGTPTYPPPYNALRPAREALKAKTPYVLINAEAVDVGSENYAAAIAASAAAVKRATGAKFGLYAAFGWERPDATDRWNTMRAAYRAAGVWPEHLIISGHWRGRTVRELADSIMRDAEIIMGVEPWARLAVLLCPEDYGGPIRDRTRETQAMKKALLKGGFDVIWWYEDRQIGGE